MIKGIVDVEFESIEVGAGSFDSQIFIIGNIESEIKGVIGFADIGGDYGSYERQLPITSTYDNPALLYYCSFGILRIRQSSYMYPGMLE
ncbi:MAG: hypothetical protein HS127_08920 [Planctomycetia bacterium]|nr:hypothetical protein [Planctomycetia bacterium]